MDPLVIRFGGYQAPASIHNRAAAFFGEQLVRQFGDRVRFELVGNVLELGRKSGDLPTMVEDGELSLCYISSVRFAHSIPELKVLELPFLIKDRATIHKAFAGSLGELYERRMRAATPFRLLGLWDNGFRHITNRVRPIRAPQDCRGLRIRTQISELHAEAFRLLGAVPIPVDVKEFVEGIAGDRFDGQDNPLTNTYNFGAHHYHRHLTLTGHFFGASAMICNEAHYQSWPADLQAAVDSGARAATSFQHELAAAEDAEILAKFDAAETEVIHLTADERQAFVSALTPMITKYRQELDGKLFELLDEA